MDINQARRAIDEAIEALSIEMWREAPFGQLERVYSPESSIAIELDRVDRAIGPAGKSMFGALALDINQAMIALYEAKAALGDSE